MKSSDALSVVQILIRYLCEQHPSSHFCLRARIREIDTTQPQIKRVGVVDGGLCNSKSLFKIGEEGEGVESGSCSTVGAAAVPEPPPPVPGSVCAACPPRSGVSVRLDTASNDPSGKERKRNLGMGKELGKMMLHFVFLARVVVGGLTCREAYGDNTTFYVVDTAKCWAGDMNAAFNEGEALMSGCDRARLVRWQLHVCFRFPFG